MLNTGESVLTNIIIIIISALLFLFKKKAETYYISIRGKYIVAHKSLG